MTAIQRPNGNSLEEAKVLVGLDDYSMHAFFYILLTVHHVMILGE